MMVVEDRHGQFTQLSEVLEPLPNHPHIPS
jgi:hypothetical protein